MWGKGTKTIRLGPLAAMFACCVTITAQQDSRTSNIQIPLDDSQFANCSTVEELARGYQPPTRDGVYTLSLLSKSKGNVAGPFMSDMPLTQVTGWIARQQPKAYPFAMFYEVYGRYRFRCRDAQDHLIEASGPGGDPLQFAVRGGTAEICHFDFHNVAMAHAYAVTDVPLESIEALDLFAQVTQRLHARYLFLYVRRDPWFFRYSLDSTPYIFADASKVISEGAYLQSQTLSCMTGNPCRLGPSWP